MLKQQVGFAVRAREFYSLFLEAGAKGGGNPGKSGARAFNRRTGKPKRARGVYTARVLEPRPFLDRVMARELPTIQRRVREALTGALKWRDTKK